MPELWYKRAFRRNVIDMHITDCDPSFLAQFDPVIYADLLELARVQSAVVYAHSHVGHCYYPTRVGHMHGGLRGRNIFGEVLEECHRRGIAVVAYMSLIFDTYAYRNNEDWKIRLPDGSGQADHSRYGVCCPNSPYRNYAAALARELCGQFAFEGIRYDMTFWPSVCYCEHCRRRFASEVGGELPTIVNWEDTHWVSFQRSRERWLEEFAACLTAAAKTTNSKLSVEHQVSTVPLWWGNGVRSEFAQHSDFLQGDFYGDSIQGSFARKLFYNLSPNLPYGFETSVCVNLGDHTARKSKELLTAKASACLADGGAFVFIDAIDPSGTLNESTYREMGQVFAQTEPYEEYLGGELCQDVGIFLSTESKFDPQDNGKDLAFQHLVTNHLTNCTPHVDAVVNTSKMCIHYNVPFGIVTKRNLHELDRHQVVVLPNLLMMDAEECDAIREYVRSGGCIYASRYTSLITKEGVRLPNFMLCDVFGVSYTGETRESYTYIAPVDDGEHPLHGFSKSHPLGLGCRQVRVTASPHAQVLGTLVLPYGDSDDWENFSSIHSNPPVRWTDDPAVVLNRFGRGKSIYVATDIERVDVHNETLRRLLKMLAGPSSFESDAPKAVEITLFHQRENNRYLLSMVNFQKDLPNIPVNRIRVRVRLGDAAARSVLLLPEERELSYTTVGEYVEFVAPQLDTLLMFSVNYR